MQLETVSLPCHQHDQFHPQILDSVATTWTTQLCPCYIQEYTMTRPSGPSKHLSLLSLPTFITKVTIIVTRHSPQSLLRSSKGSHTTTTVTLIRRGTEQSNLKTCITITEATIKYTKSRNGKTSHHGSSSCMAENRSQKRESTEVEGEIERDREREEWERERGPRRDYINKVNIQTITLSHT